MNKRFPSSKSIAKIVASRELTNSVNYLIKNKSLLSKFSNVEALVLRDQDEFAAIDNQLKGCEYHLLLIRQKLRREFYARNLFLGNSVLDDVLFTKFANPSSSDPIFDALELIKESGVLQRGFIVYPVHSFGVLWRGLFAAYTGLEMSFSVPSLGVVLSPQTNSLKRSINFIEWSAKVLGVKKKIPKDLIEHWYVSRRGAKWIEKNPLLIQKVRSFPGDYYENQFAVANKVRLSSIAILMMNSVQNYCLDYKGGLFSSSRVNNWETLDFKHYFVFYPRPHSRELAGDCVPMNSKIATLAELSAIPAELDPRFWRRRQRLSGIISRSVQKIECGYYKYSYGGNQKNNMAKIYKKIFRSLEFFHRSYRKSDDPGESIMNLAVAFEILLTDNYSKGVGGMIFDRVKSLLKGIRGVRKYLASVDELYSRRSEYVHSGFLDKHFEITPAHNTFIYVFLELSSRVEKTPSRGNEIVKYLVEKA